MGWFVWLEILKCVGVQVVGSILEQISIFFVGLEMPRIAGSFDSRNHRSRNLSKSDTTKEINQSLCHCYDSVIVFHSFIGDTHLALDAS